LAGYRLALRLAGTQGWQAALQVADLHPRHAKIGLEQIPFSLNRFAIQTKRVNLL